jgi:hypothetical protein
MNGALPDQPTVADIEGRINNFIDVTVSWPTQVTRTLKGKRRRQNTGAVE